MRLREPLDQSLLLAAGVGKCFRRVLRRDGARGCRSFPTGFGEEARHARMLVADGRESASSEMVREGFFAVRE